MDEEKKAFLSVFRKIQEYDARNKTKKESWKETAESLGLKHHADFPNDLSLALLCDESYPSALRGIPHPPHGIFWRGNLPDPSIPAIAIVGTRNASPHGLRAAKDFGSFFAKSGCSVVSGLAFGIDAAAHKGCLSAGGKTFAVLASPADDITPSTNAPLAEEIVKRGGGIISEMAPGSSVLPHHFLARNRIISGLSQAVVLIEAPEKSGSLATARFALEQNKDVFVVPGAYDEDRYAGSHALIREGAILVNNAKQVLEELKISPHKEIRPELENPAEKIIFEILSKHKKGLPIDILAEYANLDVQTVAVAATKLILKDAIQETENGFSIKE